MSRMARAVTLLGFRSLDSSRGGHRWMIGGRSPDGVDTDGVHLCDLLDGGERGEIAQLFELANSNRGE